MTDTFQTHKQALHDMICYYSQRISGEHAQEIGELYNHLVAANKLINKVTVVDKPFAGKRSLFGDTAAPTERTIRTVDKSLDMATIMTAPRRDKYHASKWNIGIDVAGVPMTCDLYIEDNRLADKIGIDFDVNGDGLIGLSFIARRRHSERRYIGFALLIDADGSEHIAPNYTKE